MINQNDAARIADDCSLAIDALNTIIENKDNLHPDYLAEKIGMAERCIEFVKTFCSDKYRYRRLSQDLT